MIMAKPLFNTIDEYIERCPEQTQPLLRQLRKTIRQAAPQAVEKISWGMATFDYYGNLVHFSAQKKHIGFYPAPSAIEQFAPKLSDYHCSKGAVQFPYEQPLPLGLIQEMVRFRVAEQEKSAKSEPSAEKEARPLRQRNPMPEDIASALETEGLAARFAARPPYQRNDYIGWIVRAKRPHTREKRLLQMLSELRAGNAYMGMAYVAREENS